MAVPSIYKSPDGEKAMMAKYDTVLARWPVPYEGLPFPTRHGKTFVIAGGHALVNTSRLILPFIMSA